MNSEITPTPHQIYVDTKNPNFVRQTKQPGIISKRGNLGIVLWRDRQVSNRSKEGIGKRVIELTTGSSVSWLNSEDVGRKEF